MNRQRATLLALLACGVSPDLRAQSTPEQLLEIARGPEQRRIEVIQRTEPAVCAVMRFGSPGGGSGVIFDPAGYVLTNYHVVGELETERMRIGLPGGRLYEAIVLGIDPGSDLAVLRIEGDGPFPFVELGDSEALEVGEPVLAMGNPFRTAADFSPTITSGIISALHRYQPGQGGRELVYPDCIQVDAPINPGNSGGPLIDMNARVVGINGRISIRPERGRVNVGVGFAIPSAQIEHFLPDLMAGRHVEHGTLDANIAFRKPTSDQPGSFFLQALFDDSLVASLGLGLGDQLVDLNGRVLRSVNAWPRELGVLPAGTFVEVGFRKRLEDGSFGERQQIGLRLPRLDTGSSFDEGRIGALEERLRAVDLLRRSKPVPAVAVAVQARIEGSGRVVRLRRMGQSLRIDDSGPEPKSLVLHEGSAFVIENGATRDATDVEKQKLQIVRDTHPWLRVRNEDGSTEDPWFERVVNGGAMVFDEAAFRLAPLDDPNGPETFWSRDGRPLGCAYFDPVQEARIELHKDGERSRILKNDRLVDGWTISDPTPIEPDPTMFRRPQ